MHHRHLSAKLSSDFRPLKISTDFYIEQATYTTVSYTTVQATIAQTSAKRDCGLNCSVRKSAVDSRRPLRKPQSTGTPVEKAPIGCAAPPIAPSCVACNDCAPRTSGAGIRKPYKARTSVTHRQTLGIIIYKRISTVKRHYAKTTSANQHA